MAGGGNGFARFLVLLRLAAGVLVAALFVGLGISGERTGGTDRGWFDRSLPFALAAVAVVVTAVVVRRGRWAAGSDPERSAPARRATAPSPTVRSELVRVLGVLARAGILAPRAPDPDELGPGIAHDHPVTAFGVLAAMAEADAVRPGFRIADHAARLAFHPTQVEQDAENLRGQVADLDRIVGAPLTVTVDEVTTGPPDGARGTPVRLVITLDGGTRTLAYRGAAKHLSTVLHVAVAGALRDRGAAVRLAALAGDAGLWIAALPASTDLDRLNGELRAPAFERWEWVDEQESYAAGDSPGMPP